MGAGARGCAQACKEAGVQVRGGCKSLWVCVSVQGDGGASVRVSVAGCVCKGMGVVWVCITVGVHKRARRWGCKCAGVRGSVCVRVCVCKGMGVVWVCITMGVHKRARRRGCKCAGVRGWVCVKAWGLCGCASLWVCTSVQGDGGASVQVSVALCVCVPQWACKGMGVVCAHRCAREGTGVVWVWVCVTAGVHKRARRWGCKCAGVRGCACARVKAWGCRRA